MSENVCIVQLSDDKYYQERKNCVRSVATYCASMGYQWKGLIGTLDRDTHIAFQKPLALLREIENFKYIGWMDLDVAIANRSFDLFNYLERANQDVVVCRDPSFFSEDMINSGVVFFKNTYLSKKILQDWWSMRVIGVDKHWRQQAGNGDADQQFLNKIIKQNNIVAHNPHSLNVHPSKYRVGDFAVHFMGYRPIDYDRFVEYANTNIKSQKLLNKYWMVYGFQSHDLIERVYEYGREDVMRDRGYSPEDIYNCAKQLIDIDVPH